MAAVPGVTQSLHTNSLDEALALPSEAAATLALRTQQVIACATGMAAVPDPFGGSYHVERLTDELGAKARNYIARIDAMGGMIPAIEQSYPQLEIAQASYSFQKKVRSGESVVVGVNRFQNQLQNPEMPLETLRIGEEADSETGQFAGPPGWCGSGEVPRGSEGRSPG